MPSSAVSSVGTKFKRSDMASSPTFTDIAEINGADGPNKTREMFDATSLDSTGGYREKKPGFRDPGQMQLTMNFTNAGYTAMNDDFESDSSRDYRLVYPDGTIFEFTGYVTSLGQSASVGDKITASVTIDITGQVTNPSA